MRTLSILGASLLLVSSACGKRSDGGDPAKTEPAKTEPAKTEPAKTEPAKSQDQLNRDLVASVDSDKTALDWTSPSGEKMKIVVKKSMTGHSAVDETGHSDPSINTLVVALEIDDKVFQSIDTGIEDNSQYAGRGWVGAVPEGVIFVVNTSKKTGKPDDSYDVRVLTWDSAKSQLVIARDFSFSDSYKAGSGD